MKTHVSAGKQGVYWPLAGRDIKMNDGLNVAFAVCTHQGHVREKQEDAFSITEDGRFLLVCDGMGGHQAGGVASRMAVELIPQKLSSSLRPIDRLGMARCLRDSYGFANRQICYRRTRIGLKMMGTTATSVAVCGTDLLFAHVGDSRGYMLRGGRLVQVTRDHTVMQMMLELGVTKEQLETTKKEDPKFLYALTQCLGMPSDSLTVDVSVVGLRQGDMVLLCSDGLTNHLSANDIKEVLLAHPDNPQIAADHLLTEALNRGGWDNITVIVAKYEGPHLALPASEDIKIRFA